jgi:hypothetical protein
VKVKLPLPPLNEQVEGLLTGVPETEQLVSDVLNPESVTVMSVPGRA